MSLSLYKKYFYRLLGIIASIELLIMILLQYINLDSVVPEALIDTLMLATLSFPLIIIFVINPFSKEINQNITKALDKKIDELYKQDKIIIAQSRQAAMGEMISMIAHQWRQPLTGIGMSVQNIQLDIEMDDIDLEKLDTKLSKIHEQIQFLSETIDNFSNFLKSKGEAKVHTLSGLVKETLAIIEQSLKNKNIRLEKSFEKDIDIKTYSNNIIQVLLSIINNAKDMIDIKEMDDGVIKIMIDHDEEHIYFKICDNAGGIPDEVLPRIFEPYYSTKEEKGGTGLGLYMAKMIVEQELKGEITAENINRGACFTISFPRKID